MKYLVAGVTITNDIIFADKSTTTGHLGGAIFALEGVRLYTDDVLYISNVGRDYSEWYGKYMEENHLSYDGLRYTLPHTHYNTVEYYPDGRYFEYSKYGKDFFEDYGPQTQLDKDIILSACSDDTKAAYIDGHYSEPIWNDGGIKAIRDKGVKVMWEIPTKDATTPDIRPRVLEMVKEVDIYSLNRPESFKFFGVETEEDAIKEIIKLGVPCFYRVGSKGAYMIADGKAVFAPSLVVGDIVDQTGCGNCSTATSMFAWFEGHDHLMTVLMSNIAAAYNLLQHGPYPVMDEKTAEDAMNLAKKRYKEITGNDYVMPKNER